VTEPQPDAVPAAVVAVVPAYRPGPNLLDLVESLSPQVTKVVVVDDGSPAGQETVDAAAARGAHVIRHDTNRGIAAALNTGIRCALETPGTVAVLTVDQDSGVPAGFVAALLDTWARAQHDGLRVGIVAPVHVTGLPDQARGRPPIQSGQLIPVATLRHVGDFDEDLFIDGVDDDFALRCLDAGLALAVADGLTLGHRLGDTHEVTLAGRTLTLTRSAPFRYYYLTRNRVVLIHRHGYRHFAWAVGQAFGLVRHLGLTLLTDPDRRASLNGAARGFADATGRVLGRGAARRFHRPE
jgi:rhamnosyltransferase